MFSLIEPIFLAIIAEVAQNDALSNGAFTPGYSYRYTLNRSPAVKPCQKQDGFEIVCVALWVIAL